MDFTIEAYRKLLSTLIEENYSFQKFEDFLRNPKERVVILRHDVDLLPHNSLQFAKIQHELGIVGTYYFRAVPESWDETIIQEIDSLGHEIGYHYENLTTCKGNMEDAIKDFGLNLLKLRELVPVTTICMHGSPMSKYDSKDLWSKYDYKKYGIHGAPYFDVDFNKMFYLTDTGRRWDGHKVSVRDKVKSNFTNSYHTTNEIIDALHNKQLPNQIMFTFHPQRWNSNKALWLKEYMYQNIKNYIKKSFYVQGES